MFILTAVDIVQLGNKNHPQPGFMKTKPHPDKQEEKDLGHTQCGSLGQKSEMRGWG